MEERNGLGDRKKHGLIEILRPALGERVKKAHRVQLVAEKFGADGLVVRRREHVENAAAQRELSHALNQRRAAVARADETSRQRIKVVFRAAFERDQPTEKRLAGDGPET